MALTFFAGNGKKNENRAKRRMQCQLKASTGGGGRGRKLTPRPRRGDARRGALRRRGGGLEAEPLAAAAEVPEQLLGEVGAEIGHLGHLSAPAGEEEGSRLRCRPLLHCTMNLSSRQASASQLGA